MPRCVPSERLAAVAVGDCDGARPCNARLLLEGSPADSGLGGSGA